MQVNAGKEELEKIHLYVATPMYGGQCYGLYMKSCMDLQLLCQSYGVKIQFDFLYNESLVTRARNYLVDNFLSRSQATHFLFLDSDIAFDANDILTMVILSNQNPDYDVMAGPYPKKNISWEKIKRAVDLGVGKENPNELENYGGDFVFNFGEHAKPEIKLDEPFQVAEAGTGIFLVKRSAFDRFAAAYPDLLYTPDHSRSENFNGEKKITAFFDTIIDSTSNRYLSEDYFFCRWAARVGIKIWLCAFVKSIHIGTYHFQGSIGHLAQLDVSPTYSKDDFKAKPTGAKGLVKSKKRKVKE